MEKLLKVLGWINLVVGGISIILSAFAHGYPDDFARYFTVGIAGLSSSLFLFSFAKVIELLEKIACHTRLGELHLHRSDEEDDRGKSLKENIEDLGLPGDEIARAITGKKD
jgi:hypothetical protein